MIQFTMISSTLVMSMIFMQMNHPLAMGLMLMIQTMLVCILSGMMSSTFWFSYMLFLIFLGGMLILFIYVTSLASNEMFSLSMKLTIMSMAMMMIFMFAALIIDKSLILTYLENNEMNPIELNKSFMQENTLNLSKLYNFPTNMITFLLINYLLITLIVVVKITNVFYGPLRHSMN